MKFFYITIIITGIILILNLGGFQTPVTGGTLGAFGIIDSSNELSPENFKASDLFSGNSSGLPGLKYILLFFAGAALVIGAFGRSPDIRYVTAALVWALVGYLTSDIVYLFTYINGFGIPWMKNLMGAIVVGLLIALYVSAISFWQGSDG